ncbi:MAG: hypothetical protein QXQ79_02220 [Candidatus Nanoarchaeia archaeon]
MGYVIIKYEEAPNLITKLYRTLNRPRICAIDKKERADYIIISVKSEQIRGVTKLCHKHEHHRRIKLKRR